MKSSLRAIFGGMVAATLALGLGIGPSSASNEAPAPSINVDQALEPCVAAALDTKARQWTCTAKGLYVHKDRFGQTQRDAKGQIAPMFLEVSSAKRANLLSTSARPADLAPLAGTTDEYDSWCENGSICNRLISAYIAETKGNAAYGNQNGAIGAYDIVIRTSLSGRRANNTLTFYHDAGPTLGFSGTTINCIQVPEFSFAQPCGSTPVSDFSIGQGNFRHTTGLVYGANSLTNSDSYVTQVTTSFLPAGYSLYQAAPWHQWSFFAPKARYGATFLEDNLLTAS